jgi:glycosyltransferase involved in cell wall biosynthesis
MPRARIELSVVTPARNEAENLPMLVGEIARALDADGVRYEIIVVDDASTDDTRRVLDALMPSYPALRVLALRGRASGRACGQSAAFRAGFDAARGALIASLDADLQNDPAEIPDLLRLLHESGADLVQGDRSASRCDAPIRRLSSGVGRLARRLLLGDPIRDTGCSLRIMSRTLAVRLPLEFRGMHRFIPLTARDLGATVVETPVTHRPRRAGTSAYGMWNRAVPGLVDCIAVRWMRRRRQPVDAVEIELADSAVPEPPEISVRPERAVERQRATR